MKPKLYYTLAFLLVPLILYGQPNYNKRIYVIILGDTNDTRISSGVVASIDRIKRDFFEPISTYQQRKLSSAPSIRYIPLMGDSLTHQNLDQVFNVLLQRKQAGEDFILFFWFDGHGTDGKDSNGFPQEVTHGFPLLMFEGADGTKEGVPIYDIYQRANQQQLGSLRIFMSQACNASTAVDESEMVCPRGKSIVSRKAPETQDNLSVFFESEGSMVMSSSALGQFTYVLPGEAAFFTKGICGAFATLFQFNGNDSTSLEELAHQIKRNTENFAAKYKYCNPELQSESGGDSIITQTPIFEGIINGRAFTSADTSQTAVEEVEVENVERFYQEQVAARFINLFDQIAMVPRVPYNQAVAIHERLPDQFFNGSRSTGWQFSSRNRPNGIQRQLSDYLRELNKLFTRGKYGRVSMSLITNPGIGQSNQVELGELRTHRDEEGNISHYTGKLRFLQLFEGYHPRKLDQIKYTDKTQKEITAVIRFNASTQRFEVHFEDVVVVTSYDFG